MQIIKINEPGESEKSDSHDEIVIGIDFGTTNSLAAFSNKSKPEIIKMPDGAELLHSIINIVDNRIIIGKKDIAKNFVRSIKRLLAKSSQEIKNNIRLNSLSDIISLDEQIPKVQLNNSNKTLPYIASYLFKYLKSYSESALGKTIKKAVISVPAYFDDAAKGQILLAANLANLEVVRLIAEPTAAAYAYGLQSKKEGTYLVYDLGGGTFDISILSMQSGILQVIATGGDNMLGGDDIDIILAQHLAQITNSELNENLILQAKEIKEKLSYEKETDDKKINNKKTNAKNIIFDSNIISREKYEELITPIIDRTIKIAKNTLYDAEEPELDGIILVGGSTRIPIISSRLQNSFSAPVYNDLDPDKIVALGAALQAENLSSQSNSLLIDVVSLSLGLELHGGMVEKLIMRNTPIPFSITKEFTTHTDNQTGMKFHIVQGEREMVKDCRSLAHFELKNIPPMKAGKARIEVTFTIDANGILSVIAKEIETGIAHNIEIKPSYGLSEKEINADLHSAYSNAKQDHKERLLVESRNQAKSLIEGLQKAIEETPDILSNEENNQLNVAINSLQIVINSDNRDKILLKIEELNKIAENFIQKHLDKGVELHLKNRHIDKINDN